MCFDKTDINAILNPLFLQNNSLDKSNIDSNSTSITPTQPFSKYQPLNINFHYKKTKNKHNLYHQPTSNSIPSPPPRHKAPSTAPRNVATSRGDVALPVKAWKVSRAKRQRDLRATPKKRRIGCWVPNWQSSWFFNESIGKIVCWDPQGVGHLVCFLNEFHHFFYSSWWLNQPI